MMVTCGKCGVENVDGSKDCRVCGSPIWTPQRRCVSCGRSLAHDANVCPYCGHDYRASNYVVPTKPLMSTGLKVVLYVLSVLIPIAGIIIGLVFMSRDDPEDRHVGKMCLILGVVAIVLSVGLAALLYFLVLSFSGGEVSTPVMSLVMSAVTDGYRFSALGPDEHVVWQDVTVLLTDGQNPVTWYLTSEELSGSGAVTYSFGSKTLGSLAVSLSVTDLSGNGAVDSMDSLTVTSSLSFDSGTDYNLRLLYEPTDSPMCSITFTG